MNDNDQTLTRRIQELEGAARKARLEAMQLGGQLLAKSNSQLAGSNQNREAEITMLRVRYEGLVKAADEAQALIDKLQAQEHDRKYHR